MSGDGGASAAGVASSAAAAGAASPAAVRVFVRLRPPSERTDIELFDLCSATPQVITIKDPLSSGRCEHSYEFAGVFNQEQGQEAVFDPVAGPAVDAALAGRSGCVLAYGQTNSGKTYAIFGEGNGDRRGLLPRAMERLFASGVARGGDAAISVSFLEVYLDKVRDLGCEGERQLEDEEDGCSQGSGGSKEPPEKGVRWGGRRPTGGSAGEQGDVERRGSRKSLEIRETRAGTVHVKGLTRIPAKDLSDVRAIIDRGLAKRAVAQTGANMQSSRSHTVFTVHLPPPAAAVQGADADADERLAGASLSFVDLAGSERLAKTRAEGARFLEAVAINTSLTALGKVVLALASPDRHPSARHVPYRDSKLTRILSQSLGGGAQVSLLATLHPRVEDYEESLNTLSFADRCKNVAHLPTVEYFTAKAKSQKRIAELQAQAAELKDQLKQLTKKHSPKAVPRGLAADGSLMPMDSVDVAINEAIKRTSVTSGQAAADGAGDGQRASAEAAGADGKASKTSNAAGSAGDQAQSGAPAGSKTSATAASEAPPPDPHIRVLMELQEQRSRQAKARQDAAEAVQALEEERTRLAEREKARQEEAAWHQDKNQTLSAELSELQATLDEAQKAEAEKHEDRLQASKEEVDNRLRSSTSALLSINDTLKKGAAAYAQKRIDTLEERQRAEDEHIEAVRRLKEQHEQSLRELEAKCRAKLAECEQQGDQKTEEMLQSCEAEDCALAQCQEEFVSLGELVWKLSKLVADVEDGLHPVVRRDGLKVALLPSGAKPGEPDADSYPVLFEKRAKAEDKVDVLERVVQRPLSAGRLRRTVAAAHGFYDGIVSKTGSGANLDKTNLGPLGESSFVRKVSHQSEASSNGGGSNAGEAGSAPALAAKEPPVDAAMLAGGLCTTAADLEAERLLIGLPAERLADVCRALRGMSLEAFDHEAEREALRREFLSGLDDEATLNYVRQLESRRDAARCALADAVERAGHLRFRLESGRKLLPRPGSAASTTAADSDSWPPSSRPSSAKTIAAAHMASYRSLSHSRALGAGSPVNSRANSMPKAPRSRPPSAGFQRSGNLVPAHWQSL